MSEELFSPKKKLYIIDGYALIYRSYFALISSPIRDGEGNNVSAVFGFFKTVMKLLREYHPDYLVVALDSHAPTFRHQLYPAYKANRDKAPDDLHAQVPVIERILEEMHVPHINKPGFEADDIIATLSDEAKRQDIDTVIFTGDKDLLQLVDDRVKALRPPKPKTNDYRMFGEKEVKEEYGVMPGQIVDYLSLIGDSSDNVPGVAGIGPVGAVKLLASYGTLKGVYQHLDDLSPSVRTKLLAAKDHMDLTRTLIELKHDVMAVDSFDTPQFLCKDIDYRTASQVFDRLKLASLSKEAISMAPQAAQDAQKQENDDAKAGKRGVYHGVTDMGELSRLLSVARSESAYLAFDTETNSLDEMNATLLGFSFAWKEGEAYYVPVGDDNRNVVKAILSDALSVFQIIGQNVKYDYKVMKRLGVTMAHPYFDTMIAAWLLDSAGRAFNLDYLADRYLNYKTIHYDDLIPKGKTIADVPLQQAKEYGGEDSDLAFRLWRLFEPQLKERHLDRLMRDVEMPLITVLAEMEWAGITLDVGRVKKLDGEFSSMMQTSEAQIYAYAGTQFNLNSPAQMQKVLFTDLKIPPGAKTRTGYSTSSDVLEPLADTYPIVKEILAYRQVSKLKNTYVDTLPGMIEQTDGRIHPHFLQTGTETGRLSCNNPNLQNIPVRSEEGRKIRSAFVASPGCVFLSADYSQIELVVLSHMAQDTELMDAFRAGEDIHRSTAAKIYHEFDAFVTPEQRRVAKTINFGVVYGISAHSLSIDLGITHAEAKSFIDNYFDTYKGVAAYIDRIHTEAEKNGFVTTLLGHQREIKEIRSANHTEKAKAQRVSVNTVIQGSAADIVKLAMLKVTGAMREAKVRSRLLLQIHDELIFEVPNEEVEMMTSLVKKAMEGAYQLSVPLKVSIETAPDWGGMH
ncbi:MAG: DNA polymerase I [Sphaerochaeta sp.]|nr:DNA polymerase I [Sphaerochaeta sp.]